MAREYARLRGGYITAHCSDKDIIRGFEIFSKRQYEEKELELSLDNFSDKYIRPLVEHEATWYGM
jgi:hypothetical protein